MEQLRGGGADAINLSTQEVGAEAGGSLGVQGHIIYIERSREARAL